MGLNLNNFISFNESTEKRIIIQTLYHSIKFTYIAKPASPIITPPPIPSNVIRRLGL